jgi:hypothetical protein
MKLYSILAPILLFMLPLTPNCADLIPPTPTPEPWYPELAVKLVCQDPACTTTYVVVENRLYVPISIASFAVQVDSVGNLPLAPLTATVPSEGSVCSALLEGVACNLPYEAPLVLPSQGSAVLTMFQFQGLLAGPIELKEVFVIADTYSELGSCNPVVEHPAICTGTVVSPVVTPTLPPIATVTPPPLPTVGIPGL